MLKLEKILKNTLYGGMLLGTALLSQNALAQNYDANFKVRELTHGTGANIANTDIILIDTINNNQYMAKTDANGVATIPQMKAGNYKMIVSEKDHVSFEKKNYTVDGAEQVNVSLISKHQIGPIVNGAALWIYDFDVDKFKNSTGVIFGTGKGNPLYFSHVYPIEVIVEGGTQIDLNKITATSDTVNKYLGFEVFKIVDSSQSKDNRYTFFPNAGTGSSEVGTDLNGVITRAYTYLMNTNNNHTTWHETWSAIFSSDTKEYNYITIKDARFQNRPTSPQPGDYADARITMNQGMAIKNTEQNVFNMSELQEYVSDIAASKPSTALPVNGASNLGTSIEFKIAPVNARKYRLQISRNSTFTDLIFNKDIFRNDTTINNIPQASTLYVREEAINNAGTSTWSDAINFTTAAAPAVNITSPASGATVQTKFTSTWTGGTAPYRVQILDANSVIVKDSSNITVQSATFDVVRGHRGYTLKVKASNTDWTSEPINTANNNPTAAAYTSPANNSVLNASNYINGKLKIIDSAKKLDQDLDTQTNTLTINGPGVNWSTTTSHDGLETLLLDSAMFQPNTQYTATITTSDGYVTVNGNSIKFTTAAVVVNYPPTNPVPVTPEAGSTKDPRQSITFKWRKSTDQNGDAIKYKGHVWNSTLDTTINNISDTLFVMAANKLKNNQTFNYTITASDGKLESTSGVVSFNTSLPKPGDNQMTNPTNGQKEVVQPVTYTSTVSSNAEGYEYRIFDQNSQLKLDTIVQMNSFVYSKLENNKTYSIMVRGINSSQNGNWSNAVTYTMFDDAPTITATNPAATDKIKVTEDLAFAALAYDKNNDPIIGSLEIKNNEQDTTIYNLTPDNTGKINYILKKESNFLKPQKTYNYIFTANDGTKSSTATGQFSTLGTGIENLVDKSGIKIYPTIGSEYINIECNPIKPVTYNTEIFDMSGRLVYHNNDKIYGTEIKDRIDVSGLKNGMYVLLVTLDNESKPQKIVIQK